MKRIGRSIWGKAAVVALSAVVVLGVAAFAAWRLLGQRTGEAAIQYIPADAGVVVSVDTAASTPSQIALFKRIGDAMDSEGLLAKLDDLLPTISGNLRVFKELRRYCTKSFAFAVWIEDAKPPKIPPMVWLTAVTDSKAVDDILSKNGSASPDAGSHGYKLKDVDAYAAVVRGYLAVSDRPELIARVEKTASGGEPSIAGLAEYRSARNSLPPDANMMFFMSPAGIKASEKLQGGNELYAGMQWAAFSMSLREEGLSFDYQYPGTAKAGSVLAQLANIKPVDPALLKRLPDGAYGLSAVSQPSEYWPMVEKSVGASPQSKGVFDQGMKAFREETGFDVERDILPAFKGDLVYAFYPARQGKSVDMVLEFTDANSADPATLADKVRALVEKKTGEKGGKAVRFVLSKEGDVTVWTLDEQSRSALMKSAAGPPPAARMSQGMPPGMQPGRLGSVVPSGTPGMPPGAHGFNPAPPPAPPSPMLDTLKDKTVNYAVIGKSLIVTSSKASLDQAVAAYRGQGKSLVDDQAYTAMQGKLIPQAQGYVMVDVGRIAEALRPTLEEGLKQSEIKADDILGLFGDGKTGIMFSSRYDGSLVKGTGTMPLDYIRLIRLTSKGLDMAVGPKGAHDRGPAGM